MKKWAKGCSSRLTAVSFVVIVLLLLISLSACENPTDGNPVKTDSSGVQAEGSIDSPVDIGDPTGGSTVHIGETARFQDSLYVTTVNTGKHYMVTVTEMTEDVNLYVYSDSSFLTSVGSSSVVGTANEKTILLKGNDHLYIRVGLESGSGADYKLVVTEADEGTEGPAPETATDLGTIVTSANGSGEIKFMQYGVGFDVDWWQFSLGSTQTVTVETSQYGPDKFDTEIWLYEVNSTLADVVYSWDNPDYDLIGEADMIYANDDESIMTSYSQITQSLGMGNYVVAVGYSAYWGTPAPGEYNITVSVE